MNSRLPNNIQIPVLMTQNSLSALLSPSNSPRGSNSNYNNMDGGSSSGNNTNNEKLDKLKDITSKTIDQVIFKLTEMKREKQFLQSFKDIMKISETLIEIDRTLKPIQITEAELSRTSSSSSFSSRPTTPRKDTLTSSGGSSLSGSRDNNNPSIPPALPASSSTLEAELIQIIHNKSNTIKKSKAHDRSTDSIESVHAIIHKCLDLIKAKVVQVKKNLVFEQNPQTALQYGEMIRNIRNQVNTFRTLSLPQNLNLCDGEKLLLKVENCHYHLYDNSHNNNNDSKSSSNSNNNHHHNQKQTSSNSNPNNQNNTPIEDDIVKGTIFVTNYQIIFFGIKSNNNSSNNNNNSNSNLNLHNNNEENIFIKQFSLHSINKWTKSGKKKSPGEYSYKLTFICKDYRNHIISFDKTTTSLKDVRKCIENQRLTTTSTLFCFTLKQDFSKFENTNLGWSLYNAREEYARMGVPSPDWRVSDANHNFFVCDTYPALIGVPESINDEQLKSVAQFRSKGRIPSLSYRHWSNKCSITRCSQPKVGIGKNRSEDDEILLNAIRCTSTAKAESGGSSSSSSSNKDRKLYILDARPYANAVGNRAKGAGWEVMANYPGCVIEFLNIANIHAMRNSLNKIKESSVSSLAKEDSWYSSIESSGWMNHIKLVLQGAIRVAKLVHTQHSNVLVHCSDGWDRTSQLVALAELFLDPYFRTLRGFQVLIEKEWLSYGHKFAQRNGQIHNKDEDERSPIFYQFLEAVYQVVQQFPTKFEFNAHFLRVILYHSYSGKYGNFLYNSEKERIQNHSFGKTISLWAEMDLTIKDYLNPLFVPSTLKERDVIFPDCSLKTLRIWDQIYLNNLSDTEIYGAHEKVVRQVMDKHLDERAEAFRELYPLKQKRSHTASLSFANPRQSMSISQLNLLPSFHLSNTIPKNSGIELENIVEESVDFSENISSTSS
ncbi:hypothetical protein CYY_000626 [Polysphondylium violaceum]|uniref:Myotubularin phosphatase domain-containing protein n=1 Tax=Polysphondylium violaceum TaxID=133409 RepID=A0A8J4V291_9MYCE|nr:hypothetical protein CYY_000626 [Polysphondylium violaceum]